MEEKLIVRDSVILYRIHYNAIKDLSLEQKGMLLDCIFSYTENYELPLIVDPIVSMAFQFFKQQLDKDKSKYDEVCLRNRENGQKGGRPRTNPKNPVGYVKTQKTQTNPKNPVGYVKTQKTQTNPKNPNEPDNDNDNVNDKDIKPKGYTNFNFSFVNDSYKEAFYRWIVHKHDCGNGYKTQNSLEAAYKLLVDCCNGNSANAEAIVERSIGNNWSGLFPLNGDFSSNKKGNFGTTMIVPKDYKEWKR